MLWTKSRCVVVGIKLWLWRCREWSVTGFGEPDEVFCDPRLCLNTARKLFPIFGECKWLEVLLLFECEWCPANKEWYFSVTVLSNFSECCLSELLDFVGLIEFILIISGRGLEILSLVSLISCFSRPSKLQNLLSYSCQSIVAYDRWCSRYPQLSLEISFPHNESLQYCSDAH